MNLKKILENKKIQLKFKKINPNEIFEEELSKISLNYQEQKNFEKYALDERGVHPLFDKYISAFKKVDEILLNLSWDDARKYVSLMNRETNRAFYFSTIKGLWKCKGPSPDIEIGHE